MKDGLEASAEPARLAAHNLEFVTEHHQLDVLHTWATATADEQAKQSLKSG